MSGTAPLSPIQGWNTFQKFDAIFFAKVLQKCRESSRKSSGVSETQTTAQGNKAIEPLFVRLWSWVDNALADFTDIMHTKRV
jgi:hypothetical protein